MNETEFLNTVITTPQGNFCLATNNGTWQEHWFRWPDDIADIVKKADASECDTYFSSYLFSDKRSLKECVLPSRTIQADLDDADVGLIELQPSVLVKTSNNRHQGFWLLDDALSLDRHEQLSKKITYSIPLCDHSGWALGRKVRFPGTNNYKYERAQRVEIETATAKVYARAELDLSFIIETPSEQQEDTEDFITNPFKEFDVGPQEFLERIKDHLPPKVTAQYNVREDDRSKALWAFECACFRISLDRYEVFYLAFHNANNKFADLHVNGTRELAKDVLRAERIGVNEPKAAVQFVRSAKIDNKKRAISETVIGLMKQMGTFYQGVDTVEWFVHKGQPMPIARGSRRLNAFLDNQLGLNATEPETHFVVESLITYAHDLPSIARTGALTYYDVKTNVMYLHTGRSQVIRITPSSISHITNGTDGLIFPWQQSFEPFVPLEPFEGMKSWYEQLFGDSLGEVVGLSRAEAITLLRVWFLFLLFRSTASARPLLTILGEPGAGKSAMLRRVYAVFYGGQKKIGAITGPDEFDTQTSNFPLVVFDNADSYEKWLPDRLAQIANDTDIERRMLYTNNEIYDLKRHAMVALTAHDPRFGRADVVDRLLIISLKRLTEFKDETSMINEVLSNRSYIWGSLIDDMTAIVRTPKTIDTTLQFRIQDFATVGLWIAKALGIERVFREAIEATRRGQHSFIIEEEDLLVDTIRRAVNRGVICDRWINIAEMWNELEVVTRDLIGFEKKYKNTLVLSRRLHALRDTLNSVVDIQWEGDGVDKVWRLSKK